MPSLFMRIFAHDLSGNCLGGAKSRFKAILRVGVAPLIITLPPARIRSWVSKSIQDGNYWTHRPIHVPNTNSENWTHSVVPNTTTSLPALCQPNVSFSFNLYPTMPRESSNNSGPPNANPVLTAYESYLRDTPLITRYVLNATVISYLTGFFFSPAYLLANIPIFTLFKFQLYRILTSPLICTDILSLFFTFMGFMNHGVKLEQ
jgi:hypothetical protein